MVGYKRRNIPYKTLLSPYEHCPLSFTLLAATGWNKKIQSTIQSVLVLLSQTVSQMCHKAKCHETHLHLLRRLHPACALLEEGMFVQAKASLYRGLGD